jgi:biopolymer transport protein ExbD
MNVRVDLQGFVDVDGERIKITALEEAVEERLDEDPNMVISLSWSPAASFDDFVAALAQAKAGGAKRIAVQSGSQNNEHEK